MQAFAFSILFLICIPSLGPLSSAKCIKLVMIGSRNFHSSCSTSNACLPIFSIICRYSVTVLLLDRRVLWMQVQQCFACTFKVVPNRFCVWIPTRWYHWRNDWSRLLPFYLHRPIFCIPCWSHRTDSNPLPSYSLTEERLITSLRGSGLWGSGWSPLQTSHTWLVCIKAGLHIGPPGSVVGGAFQLGEGMQQRITFWIYDFGHFDSKMKGRRYQDLKK